MSLRCSRSPLSTLRRLTLALLLCAVSGSISAWAAIGASRGPAASAAVTIPAPATKSPALVLVSQEPSWVGPSQPSLSLTVATNQSGSGLTVGLTFYGRVVTRSSFTQALSGSPAQGVLLHTTPVAVAGGEAHTTVCADISPTEGGGAAPPNSTCPPDSPRVDLDCVAGSGSCDGVYPVTITLARQGSTVSRITTFVTYDEPQASSVPKPLRVALVMPLNLSTSFTPSADGAQALVTPTKANATALSQVVSDLDQQSTVPTTILTTGRTVQTLRLAGRSGRDALEQLSDLSGGGGATAVSQMPSQGYVPFNPGQLVASGLKGEIDNQLARAHTLTAAAHITTTAGTWVEQDGAGTSLADGLSSVGANQLVLPENDLTSLGSSNLTESQPFQLELTKTQHVTAMSADPLLTSHFSADPGDPVLAANQLLADLAFIHYENPYEEDPRGEVALPPAGWHPNAALVDTVVKGLNANPVLAAVTLDQFFAQVPAGGNGQPTTRHLANSGAGPHFAPVVAGQIAIGRTHLAGFESAVQGRPPVLTQLGDLLLASQSDAITAAGRLGGITSFNRVLVGQLALVQLATEHTITFTARTAPIPITIISTAHYTVIGHLIVASDKFTFPQGSVRHLVLDRQINSVSIEAHSRTSGDHLPVDVTFRSPNGDLVIARGTVIVQSTSISLVGIVLTLLAAVVLLTWWIRTYLQRRGQNRPRRGAPTGPDSP